MVISLITGVTWQLAQCMQQSPHQDNTTQKGHLPLGARKRTNGGFQIASYFEAATWLRLEGAWYPNFFGMPPFLYWYLLFWIRLSAKDILFGGMSLSRQSSSPSVLDCSFGECG